MVVYASTKPAVLPMEALGSTGDGESDPSRATTLTSDLDSIRTVSSHEEEDQEKALTPQISKASHRMALSRTATSIRTTDTMDPAFEIDWDENDPENPHNWSLLYKCVALGFISYTTFIVVLYSTSYTTGIFQMQEEFNEPSKSKITLGLTTFLLGLAFGSLLLAPISEVYGRKPVYAISMFFFVVLIIPCGLSHSLNAILVVRFFGALAGSAMIANAPGTVNDIVSDEYRALAFSIWSLGPLNGPVFGPIIGGFVTQYLGWRWTNWLVIILAFVGWIMVMAMKETYSPTLLAQRARIRREETGDDRWHSRYDQRMPFLELMKVNLSRPIIMAFTEPICIFWNVYIAIIYGILYLCFVAYPIVFAGLRGWTISMSGLAFVGIGVGSVITIVMEPAIRKMINAHKVDPETGEVPMEAMVSVVCIAAILTPIGELWFAWTCAPPVHWIWPILAGIPFGAGNTAVFIYAANYLAGSYGIFSASAMAGNAVIRSLLGGLLPLAGPAMYSALGPHWSGTLLGLVQVCIIPIPVVFYKYGTKIRKKSALISRMEAERQRIEGKRNRMLRKNAAMTDVEKAIQVVGEAGMAGVADRELELEGGHERMSAHDKSKHS
jgi:multidrug resistance protein